MDHLSDTHTFMWFINGVQELSDHARKSIEHQHANNFISIASIWEMAIKIFKGNLQLKTPSSTLPEQISDNRFQILPIRFEDTLQLSTLPFHHRDPFDRLIIAQSIVNRLTVISKDKLFEAYIRLAIMEL